MKFRIAILILFLLSSCASMFNLPEQRVTINTSEPTKITINKVYSDSSKNIFTVDVPRSKNPLNVTVTLDDTIKEYSIKSHNSFAYWLNLYPFYGLGMLLDKNKPKRYAYPPLIYIDFHSTQNYLTYIPLDNKTIKLKNIVKFTPFRLFALSNPSVEFSYERKTGQIFSSQFMASYLLPEFMIIHNNAKGYRFAFEEKLYLKKSAPLGPYLSIEIDHLSSKFNAIDTFIPKGFNSDSLYRYEYSDSIRVHKQTTSLNFKFGFQNIIHRISYDFYCGIGARYRDVIHYDRINLMDEMTRPKDFSFGNWNQSGKDWVFVILLNIRIGYLF